ncbi:sensor histidine kinase [Microtetraspora fusca]|uniref:sensor histidine kinase n=1 Tax=Microtetraspora fusca TaxID=1997 RepID=UPI001C3F20E5|nr:sensor histidine kinase [Microtetraspora fusca]
MNASPTESPGGASGDRWALVAFDCAVALCYTSLVVAVTLQSDRATGAPTWAQALVLAGVGLPVAVRRLWPVAVLSTVVTMSLAALLLGVLRDPFLAACYALYAVVLARPPRGRTATSVAGVLTAAGFTALLAFGLSLPETPSWWMNRLGSVPVSLVAMAGTLTVARAVRGRRYYAARWAEQVAQRAVTEERLRIARELHDVVAHGMSLIAVKAGVANHVAEARPEEAREALRVIETASRDALAEMRRMLGVLRSEQEPDPGRDAEGAFGPAPGLAGLPALAERAGMAGVRVELEVRGAERLPDGVELSVFRIVQEALTNVVKHAAPARCRVRVEAGAREVRVEVTDDGPGRRTLPPAPGHGLVGMRERVMMYGGTFAAGPRPEGGFEVSARLPLTGTPR